MGAPLLLAATVPTFSVLDVYVTVLAQCPPCELTFAGTVSTTNLLQSKLDDNRSPDETMENSSDKQSPLGEDPGQDREDPAPGRDRWR
ncbi:hypothetical protein NN3_16850 [Nocardia neocaledoniensis NBRC 108232]|nr:hypothetical protein NN3_16850 [Nocardia neocaledoniensis NBRC 108232]